VCEMRDNPVDAEHYFRRACAIATAVLDPDHPFVATSRKNLEDFCASRGKPVKLSGPVSAIAAGADLPLTGVQERPSGPSDPAKTPAPDAAARQKPRLLVAAALASIALLAVASALWFRTANRVESRAAASAAQSAATAPMPAPTSRPAPPDDSKRAVAAPPDVTKPVVAASPGSPNPDAGSAPARSVSPPVSAKPDTATEARPASPPVVAIAELCRTLSTGGPGGWRCVRAQSPVTPGPLVYYTRVKSVADTTVRHQWSRGGRVHRIVPLRIRANAVDGYRTYSRQTVNAGASGEWSVTLTTSDGSVLHEERFIVR
jgi:hypothetical protein